MNYLRTVQVICQYFENYNYDSSTPYYKIKGSHVFEFDIDFNEFMYNEDEVKKVINHKIHQVSEKYDCKYIPIEWKLKDEVTDLGIIIMNEYKSVNLKKNEIDPQNCSRAAQQCINENCKDITEYRNNHVNYTIDNHNWNEEPVMRDSSTEYHTDQI